MSTPKDTLSRLLTLVQLIPQFPGRISTTAIFDKLTERGHRINARTVQRDLERLTQAFPIICHDQEKPYRWSLNSNLSLKQLDAPSALALHLAETQVRKLLPQSVADQVNPLFAAAHQHLDGLQHNGLADWAKIVRVLPNGKALQPAAIVENIWEQVTEALLNKQQLQVTYLSRSKEERKLLRLNPMGLVSRYTVTYLVAGVDGYSDPRQFALHRILVAERLEIPAQQPPDFNLDDYIATGVFALQQSIENVELIADIHPQQAWLLNETPLSPQQKITPLPDSDWFRLQAAVPLDQETLWWIFGLNERIRVHAPQVWVDQIRESAARMCAFYKNSSDQATQVVAEVGYN